MLSSLHIENIALIKKLDIDVYEGFSALTGETGAGKSILIDSIGLVTGIRANKDIIRSGEEYAFVNAGFVDIDKSVYDILDEQGIPFDVDDDIITLSRKLTCDGKSIAKINGVTVGLSVLKSVSSKLIAINGQHDSQGLLDENNHLYYLDSFANKYIKEFAKSKEEYQSSFDELSTLVKEFSSKQLDESERKKKLEYLKFEEKEITSAKLKQGEEENLEILKSTLANSAVISKAVKGSTGLLMGSQKPGAYDKAVMALENIEKIKDFVKDGNEIYERLCNIVFEIENISRSIDALDVFDYDDPDKELDKIESRLDLIQKIKSKYGDSIESVLEYLTKIQGEISDLEQYEFIRKEYEEKIDEQKRKTEAKAVLLNKYRVKASAEMSRMINEEFAFLDMKDVDIKISFCSCQMNKNGSDEVIFTIKTNTGEPYKNISQIASGGELSRIMLSMKKVLAEAENVKTVIFDEIDTGVSGSTSSKIGMVLKYLSKHIQVISVTHSAQVCAYAENHYKILKNEADGRMFTSVYELSEDERVNEIARILGGVSITENTIKNAKELLEQGKNI